MRILKSLLKKYWPVLVIFLITFIFFWKFFIKNLVPIPGDIIAGTYFPWFDMHFASAPFGVPVRNNVLSDVVSIMYPWRELSIGLMKQGTIPLWNPYILSGNVLLANFQSAPFYPLNIIYWIIPNFAKAWSAEVILQPLLAALFMYLFLRNNNLSKLSSLFGSLIWGFSGFFMVWLEYNTIVQASLYFPLILYAIQKSIDNRKFYILISIAVAFSFYAAYPQITLYELLFAGLFVIVVLRIKHISTYLLLFLYVVLGIALAMPFLLPGYEAAGQSIRQVDDVANKSHVKYILPEQIITFIAPDYFGNPTSRNYWLVDGAYENAVVFAGVPAFILFLSSFFIDKKKRSGLLYFSWFSFLTAAILAFKNPISELLGNSNIFLFSSAVMGRLSVVMMFGIAVSASIVLDILVKDRIKLSVFLSSFLIILFTTAVYALTAFSNHNTVALRNLVIPLTMSFAGAFLIIVTIKFNKYKYIFLVSLILLEVFDLFHFHDKYNPFTSTEFLYPKNPVTDFIQSKNPARFESEDTSIMPPNMWMPYGLFSASGQDAVHSLRYNKFLGLVNTGNLLPGDRFVRVVNYNSPLFDFLGIEYIAAVKWKNASPDFEGKPSYKFDNPKFNIVFDSGRSVVLRNAKVYPRIFAVGGYVLANSDDEFIKQFSSVDLAKKVILEKDPANKFGDAKVLLSGESFAAGSTTATVSASSDTMIILTQNYFPGWRAFVDNKEVPLYRADYTFMAVPVPKGIHSIKVTYNPDSFRWGLTIGGISLLILLAVEAIYFYGDTIKNNEK